MAVAATQFQIPDGVAGTRETLKLMRVLTLDGKRQPQVREMALSIVQDLDGMDWLGEVQAVFDWVRANIRYVKDTNDVELVHYAEKILQQRAGDCDDMSVILCSLLESIGYPTGFEAVSFTGIDYGHVFAFVDCEGLLITMDATVSFPLGWYPPNVVGRPMMIQNSECDEC